MCWLVLLLAVFGGFLVCLHQKDQQKEYYSLSNRGKIQPTTRQACSALDIGLQFSFQCPSLSTIQPGVFYINPTSNMPDESWWQVTFGEEQEMTPQQWVWDFAFIELQQGSFYPIIVCTYETSTPEGENLQAVASLKFSDNYCAGGPDSGLPYWYSYSLQPNMSYGYSSQTSVHCTVGIDKCTFSMISCFLGAEDYPNAFTPCSVS